MSIVDVSDYNHAIITAGLLTGNPVFAHMFQHSRKLETNHLCLSFQCLLCSITTWCKTK
jgi:hypothetical protein